jgi:hypothetical protein
MALRLWQTMQVIRSVFSTSSSPSTMALAISPATASEASIICGRWHSTQGLRNSFIPGATSCDLFNSVSRELT